MSRGKYTVPTELAAPKTNRDQLVNEIQMFVPQIAKALPRHIDADRMVRVLITEVTKNPKLAECDKASFFGAILYCSQLGLEPGAALGHAFLIPRKTKNGMEVQLQIGFQGMIDLVERDGRITIEAHLVFQNDFFKMKLGTSSELQHEPELIKDGGTLIGAYAVARYKDGRCKFRFIKLSEIEDARKRSQSGSFGPWTTDYNEMARKTAIRRLFKMLPKSIELARALELEETVELDRSQNLHVHNPIEQIKISDHVDVYASHEVLLEDFFAAHEEKTNEG